MNVWICLDNLLICIFLVILIYMYILRYVKIYLNNLNWDLLLKLVMKINDKFYGFIVKFIIYYKYYIF